LHTRGIQRLRSDYFVDRSHKLFAGAVHIAVHPACSAKRISMLVGLGVTPINPYVAMKLAVLDSVRSNGYGISLKR
jgi:hypothetical protein